MTQEPRPVGEVVGAAVKEARRHEGLSQEDLGRRMRNAGLDWTRNQVANLENGRMARLDLREVVTLAVALGVSPIDLIAPRYEEWISFADTVEGTAADVRAWFRGESSTLAGAAQGPSPEERLAEMLEKIASLAERAAESERKAAAAEKRGLEAEARIRSIADSLRGPLIDLDAVAQLSGERPAGNSDEDRPADV